MKINKKNITVVIQKRMGKLLITWKGKTKEYLINTEVDDHVVDDAVERILKHYPQEATVDFIELW